MSSPELGGDPSSCEKGRYVLEPRFVAKSPNKTQKHCILTSHSAAILWDV